jgi:multidrug transporter EmrE-like cation transporter
MFGTMGPKMMMYYCAGPIVACLIYYSGQSMGWIARSKRSLLKTEDGETDSTALFWTIANVIAQASIVILLNINFHLSILADLNIGIAQTVHASQAFFVALLDFVIFGAFLEKSQITGMLIILVCVFFISFSSDSSIPDEPSVHTKLAVYIPILFSFTVPCAQAANIMISKRVTTVLGVNPWDFTVGVYAIMATVFQLWGFIYW